MATLTATSIQTDGKTVGDMSGTPIRVVLDLQSGGDTFAFGAPVRAWALKGSSNDLHLVSESSGTFSITSTTGTGKSIQLFIWPAKR